MSSGFVSGGTTEQPAERNELWMKAEEELAAARKSKEEQKTHDGKSLYEVLQANKAAKQEAFEESIKLKNQFRSLDEDDVNFLNSIRDADKAHQNAMRKETEVQLEVFRSQQQQQQEPTSHAILSGAPSIAIHKRNIEADGGSISWQATTRKRKKNQDSKTLPGIKSIKLNNSRSTTEANSATKKEAETRVMSSTASRRLPKIDNVVPTAMLSNEGGGSSGNSSDESTKSALEASSGEEKSENQVKRSSMHLGLLGYSSDDD